MRTLLSTLVLLAGASASAQPGQSPAIVVLQHTRTNGLEVLAPGAPRAAGSDAAVITWANGSWTLQTLGEGETARDARPLRVRPVPPVPPVPPDVEALGRTQRTLREQVRRLAAFQPSARPVVFSVEADVPTPDGASPTVAAAALVSVLDGDDALASLSIQTPNATRTSVAAEFAFESVEAWTEWSARSLAWQRLEALGSPRTRLSIQR